ncbi:MAG: hypothetical protein ACE5GT_08325, partial [Rhodospirillales bacterium]
VTGELAEWLPQGVYGYQRWLENVIRLSPLSYPVMAVGKLFGVADALLLLKGVLVLEMAVFAFGFLALAEALIGDETAALFALVPVVLTTVMLNQILFSFRIVYLVPLMTYYLLAFFRTGRLHALVMVAVIGLASVFGNTVYFGFYYAIYLVVAGAAFLWVHGLDRPLVADRRAAGVAVLGLLFAAAAVPLVLTATDGLAIVMPGRDPATLRVDLETFLTYGGGGIGKTLEALVAMPIDTLDVTFYVPAAALVFAVYALARERDRDFVAVAATFAVMVVFAWGRYSPLAYAVYYIPGVDYLRHVGLLYAVPKMLLCLMAGFGVRRFLAAAAGGAEADHRERRFLAAIAWVLGGTVAAVLLLAVLATGTVEWMSMPSAMLALSAAGFAAVAAALSLPDIRRRGLLGALAGTMVLQAGIWTVAVSGMMARGYEVPPAVKAEAVRAGPLRFEETRPVAEAHPRASLWRAFRPGRFNFQTYVIRYGTIDLDPCYPTVPRVRMDFQGPGVAPLVRRLFGPDAAVADLGAYHERSPDAVFFRLAGCDGRAKLQLVTRFEERVLKTDAPVAPEAMASGVLVERAGTGERRFVRSTAGEYPNATSLAAQGIVVTHFSANRLEAAVRVGEGGGAWLVYADGFHPAWRALVDGRPAPVWRANMAFKALYLPPGTRSVAFLFVDPKRQAAFWFAGLIGALAIVVGVIAAVIGAPAAAGPDAGRRAR